MSRSNRGKRRGAVLRRLSEELDLLFLHEFVDERLDGVELTGVGISPDRKVVTVHYLAPEDHETEVAAALEGVLPLVEERAAGVLRKLPEVRFRYDRGAGNERRVEAILDELRRSGELPPEGPGPAPDDRP